MMVFSSSLSLLVVLPGACNLNSLDSCHLSFLPVQQGPCTIFPGYFMWIDFKGLQSIRTMSSTYLNPPEYNI